jgi:hypothetical protein
MVDTHERDSLPVTRPGREGQLVVVATRARPDQNPEAAAVRSNRRQPPPRMWAPACPAEDDRAAVGRPRRVNAFGRPAAGAETAHVSSVGVDDPQAPAGATWNASAECNLTVAWAPTDSRTVGVDLTNTMEVRAVAVHHEQWADELLPDRLSDKGDPASVARPGRSAAVARQLLEVAVWIASEYPAVPDCGDRTARLCGRCRVRGFPSCANHGGECDKAGEDKWGLRCTCHYSKYDARPFEDVCSCPADAAFRSSTRFSGSAIARWLRAHRL